ncbi:glycosyltransferase family 2 protein [Aliarcobacter sp. ERUVET-8]|uniref:glycosyltransferase family 2 protein n=1 Tax=Aliarcobacter sp. ERUVET-8 TaxID=3429684 RepID=UPI003D6B33C8
MKFSIVTPTYNHKKYIDTTIKSVLENKKHYPNVEYIVIDGNSKDGTQDVVRSYGSEVDLFISEPDKGQSDAINKGFTHATGDIYAYINSDDYYYPETFKKVAKIFEENPDIDVVYGNCTFVTEDEQFYRYFTEIEPYSEYRLRSCTDFIMQPACFWRKEIYDKCEGFTKDFHFGFDWEMWCRMAKHGAKFHYERELFAVNREFEETKTSTGGGKRLKELKQINNLHKMSMLPYAYYSYSSGEYRIQANNASSTSEKIGFRLKALFYRLLSINNMIYNNKYFTAQNLYGVVHHSAFLEKDVTISFPYYKEEQSPYIVLVLQSHIKNQEVNISINQKTPILRTFKNKNLVLIYQVKDLNKNQIDIELKFSKFEHKAFGLRNKLFNRKIDYASTYIMCDVLSQDEMKNCLIH